MHLHYSVLAGLCIRDMGVDHDENIQFRQPGLLFMWKKDQFDPVRSTLSVLKVRLGSSDLELRNTNDIHVNDSDYTRVAANSVTQFKACMATFSPCPREGERSCASPQSFSRNTD